VDDARTGSKPVLSAIDARGSLLGVRPMTELWRWQAVDLAASIARRDISSREAVLACLARTHAVNPSLNAIVQLQEEAALLAADAADAAVARGDRLGVLHGVPVTTKINVDQQGWPTTNGIEALRDNIATEDSPVVANLKKAGAILFGRTNTPAFSMRWFTDNALHGLTSNPWSKAHTPGGSSGGASSAVAAGMGPIAHGNDLAGSVRYPAYCTGVFGLRPSFGRVPAFLPSAKQERPLSAQLMSVQGPLARSVADIRLALAAMAQADVRDVWWVPAPLVGLSSAEPIRVAMTMDCGHAALHPALAQAIRQAGQCLEKAGYVVEEVAPPPLAELMDLWDLLARNENLLFIKAQIEALGDDGIKRSFLSQFGSRPLLDMETHLRAIAKRTTLIRQWALFMERYPIVLGPVSADLPFTQGQDIVSPSGARHTLESQAPGFAVPVLGFPAISVMLPIGVQLMGARFREDQILDAAQVLEAGFAVQVPIDPR
jgi:amidase